LARIKEKNKKRRKKNRKDMKRKMTETEISKEKVDFSVAPPLVVFASPLFLPPCFTLLIQTDFFFSGQCPV